MDLKKNQITVTTQTQRWLDQEHPTVYSNLMAAGMTPFDLTLIFGEVSNATPTEVVGTPRVKVILAPEQAANLIELLTHALKLFVDANGPLRAQNKLRVQAGEYPAEKKTVRH